MEKENRHQRVVDKMGNGVWQMKKLKKRDLCLPEAGIIGSCPTDIC
jgi:hypothetical protein